MKRVECDKMATLITTTTPYSMKHARRGVSARTLTTATEAAQKILHKFEGQTKTSRQVLDRHQLQKLSLTLNRKYLHQDLDVSTRPPPAGTPLPPGYHLVYFAPTFTEEDLGADGTDRTFNAPLPFSRRMWAGGKMTWTQGCPLRVGEEVEERTVLMGATAKKSRNGSEMVLVDVAKEFWGKQGLALRDERSWIFRPPPENALSRVKTNVRGVVSGSAGQCSMVKDVILDGSEFPQRQFRWSPLALFRFSALTFNGHMIHYNESWTKNIEGHPDVVVHGPLNLIGMMDYWRDVQGAGKEAREISYRALSPLYAGDEYVLRTDSFDDSDSGRSWSIIVNKGDKVCMQGTIKANS